jgi:hypothetical protein
MGTATMALPEAPKPSLAELLKDIVLPSKAAHNERLTEIAGRASELVRNIASVLDDLISAAIEQRTADDFRKAALQIFPQYYAVMRALGDIARIVIPKQTMSRLSAEWFSELESDFRNTGPSTFGADLAERGLFTAWTLRKISDLAEEVSRLPAPAGNEAADAQMAIDFAAKAFWTRLHVDCLVKAMRDNKPIYPDVVEPIRDGLRAAVNTYACIRQWVDIRNPRPEPEIEPLEWTDEDEELLADSMRDLDRYKTVAT